MLKLIIYNNGVGYLVNLTADTKIRIKVKNPLFGDAGLFSYLIKVYRHENDRFFSYATALDNIQEIPLTFKLEVGTDVFAEGDIKITESDDDFIEFYLKSGNSSVAYFLKNTVMNKADLWGTHTETSVESLSGNYPQYKIVAPAIAYKNEFIYNLYNVYSNTIFTNNYPGVYLPHLLKSLVNGLGYTLITNHLNNNADINRTALFSPVYKKGEIPTNNIKRYLPAVALQDFLQDVKDRFNLGVVFSPFMYEADIVSIDNAILLQPVDWTNKFKAKSKTQPPYEKALFFTQDADDKDDLLSVPEIIERAGGAPVNVPDMATLFSSNINFIYYVQDVKRYMHNVKIDPENPLYGYQDTDPNSPLFLYFTMSSDTVNYGGNTYYQISSDVISTYDTQTVNADTNANNDNLVAQFIFPELSGEIKKSFEVDVYARAKSGTGELITRIFKVESDGTEQTIGYYSITLDNSTLAQHNYKFRIAFPLELTADNRLGVKFFAKSTSSGFEAEITHGAFYENPGHPSTVNIDPPLQVWKELGIIGNYTHGNSKEKATQIKPKSKLSKNELISMSGLLFELPQTNTPSKDRDEQEDYEWIVYRGFRKDEQEGLQYAPYCNIDVLDLDKSDYTSKLQTPVTPLMSLAWQGEKGVLQQLWKNRLPWERYFKRTTELQMELTVNDITNHKIYKPFSIKENTFIIDEMDFELNVHGEIKNCKITAFTL